MLQSIFKSGDFAEPGEGTGEVRLCPLGSPSRGDPNAPWSRRVGTEALLCQGEDAHLAGANVGYTSQSDSPQGLSCPSQGGAQKPQTHVSPVSWWCGLRKVSEPLLASVTSSVRWAAACRVLQP